VKDIVDPTKQKWKRLTQKKEDEGWQSGATLETSVRTDRRKKTLRRNG